MTTTTPSVPAEATTQWIARLVTACTHARNAVPICNEVTAKTPRPGCECFACDLRNQLDAAITQPSAAEATRTSASDITPQDG